VSLGDQSEKAKKLLKLLKSAHNKAIKLVREWAREHQQELLIDWQLAIELKPLQRIPGADND
jgi:hypothetical protein